MHVDASDNKKNSTFSELTVTVISLMTNDNIIYLALFIVNLLSVSKNCVDQL